jgi:hypothetical protein
MIKYLLIVVSLLLVTNQAEARHHHHHYNHHTYTRQIEQSWFNWFPQPAQQSYTTQIVNHPSGCPRSAFCGCGSSIRAFGRPIRNLYLAANWFKFPRTAPIPGAAAVRQHHVMILEADLGNGVWQVYDPNSGGHQTRIHARSLAGYTIVNPHG